MFWGEVCRELLSPWRCCDQQKVVSPNCAEAAAAFGSANPADVARAFTFTGVRVAWPDHTLRPKLNPD